MKMFSWVVDNLANKLEKIKQSWRVYKLERKYTRRKPFYRSKCLYLICLALLILTAGGFILFSKDRSVKPTSKLNTSAEVKNTKSLTAQETGEFSGWVRYTNDRLGISLYYPPTWSAEDIDGKQMIDVHTMDNRYFLYFGLRSTGSSQSIQVEKGIPTGRMEKEGQIIVLGETIEKDKIVQKNLAKAYLYGKDTSTISDGKYQFAASFLADPEKVDMADTDLTLLDQRAIGEKILSSIRLK